MTEPDRHAPQSDPLAALWAQTEAPARDPAFALAVHERIARRLLLVDAAGLGVAGLAGAVALWGFWPAAVRILGGLSAGVGAAGPALACAAAASAAVWWLLRPRTA
ncbi:hypothetical protein ACO2Q3_10815 [Caulobacter sp. KR2-114]|uniref:hypothetical protein n=1 Tax=Caulobacter sp. KR2-114 TaxID=3400912 RepID=UPI003C0122A8